MRRSKRSLEGELFISHQGSPGLDAGVAAWMGLDPKHLSKGQVLETPVVTCAHCQFVVVSNPLRTREREWCGHCDKYICDDCAKILHVTLRCQNFEHKVEAVMEEAEHGTSPLLITSLERT